MFNERRMKIRKLAIILGILFWGLCGDYIFAENVSCINDGMIYFTTKDTKAVSGIRWKTVGFTVTRERCLTGKSANGGYPNKLTHTTVYLEDAWKKEKITGNEVEVTFIIPQSVVSAALIKSGMGDIKNDDILYLHGIFQITHDGRDYGNRKYSLPAIATAESWANPDDFRDRFDVKVLYKAPDEPVSIQYKTSSGDIIETETYPKNKWVKPGTKVSVELAEQKICQGKKYKLYKSYIRNYFTQKAISGYGASILTGDSFSKVQKRAIQQRIGGVQFVAIMKPVKTPKLESEQSLESEWDEPMPHGMIAADKRGASIYDVEAGIPATDSLYLNVFSKNYLLGYEYENVVGQKEYQVTFSKTYHLKWTELENGTDPQSTSIPVKETVTVRRTYSYWKLVKLEYYKIKQATIENHALPNQKVQLEPKGYQVPKLDYQKYNTEKEHIEDPVYQKHITLPSETIVGEESCPAVPVENFDAKAEAVVGKIRVRNDKIVLGKKEISQNNWVKEKTEKPVLYDGSEEIGQDILYDRELVIPKDTANAVYETTGTITYEAITRVGNTNPMTLTYEVEELNSVTVHTPVVCNARVSDERQWNQMLAPDRTKTALVLDRTFTLHMPTEGEHLQIPGYGLRDYGRYMEERKAKFPFDVYCGKSCIPAHTWITITDYDTEFYLPIWVEEGNYSIECRTTSISSQANEGDKKEEDQANLQIDNYVAVCSIPVEISGRLYGFLVTDISNYPLWYPVFRKTGSLKPSGIRYYVGNKNQDGVRRSDVKPFIIPLLKGSHPWNHQAGITPLGYTFRFQLQSIGEMYGENDYVQITPSFYWIDKEGNSRQEVDLYYGETIEGKKHALVKVGSQFDLCNVKSRYLGDPYLAVPAEEIEEKQRLTGMDSNKLLYKTQSMFTFHHILLSEWFRTYVGKKDSPTGEIPDIVEEKKAAKSKQKWYGEYYLPSQLYAVPKEFDLVKEEEKHGSFNFREAFWLRDGSIMVQFDIVTIQNGKKHLSYTNLENAKRGYCNMWEKEGFAYQRQDSDGMLWELEDGDVFLYNANGSAGLDYHWGGTH